MDALELAPGQFAITSVVHHVVVPVSIGSSTSMAICQTAHARAGEPVYDRMSRVV